MATFKIKGKIVSVHGGGDIQTVTMTLGHTLVSLQAPAEDVKDLEAGASVEASIDIVKQTREEMLERGESTPGAERERFERERHAHQELRKDEAIEPGIERARLERDQTGQTERDRTQGERERTTRPERF